MIARRLDHIAVTVSDLERSLRFYRDVLGLREVERHLLEGDGISTMTGKPGVVMQVVRLAADEEGPVLIDLQQYVSPAGGVSSGDLGDVGHAHICFVVEDLDAACSRLREHGVDLVSDPVAFDLESGSLQVVFVRDPDRCVVELVQYPTSV